MKKNIIAGLDLGTTKVCAVIAEQDGTDINVLGFGAVESTGLTRGQVSNLTKTAEAISQAMDKAQTIAGVEISRVNVGVAGEHIRSLRHRNYVTISNPEKEIMREDIIRLKEDVKTIAIPSESQILHIIPEEFIVDTHSGIEDPIGMCGSKLEAVNHVVIASSTSLRNIQRSIERAGYEVGNYILQPLASSASVLEENEIDLGVILIDIGGGTTDVAIFHNKSIKYTKVFGVAGNQVTRDIRESLGIVTSEAEQLKKNYGYATQKAIVKEEEILIKGVGARGNIKIPVTLLTQIIHVRMKELFAFIDKDLRQTGLKNKVKAGVVLTGGGSLLHGCVELAEEVFGLPAKIGVPEEFNVPIPKEIQKPEFATVAGLIRGLPDNIADEADNIEKNKVNKNKKQFTGFFKKVLDFFDEL